LVPCGAPAEQRARDAETVDRERRVIEARRRIEVLEAALIREQRFARPRGGRRQAELLLEQAEQALRARARDADRGLGRRRLHAVEVLAEMDDHVTGAGRKVPAS